MVKDKAKRDKKAIADLLQEKHKLYIELQEKDAIARKLMQLIKQKFGNALDADMFEIVQNDHFLRKQI